MNNTIENQKDLIDRYLMGKLSLWELGEIEERIKSDSIFSQEVSFRRDILIGIAKIRKAELKDRLKKIKTEKKVFKLQFDKGKIVSYAIAASITIFVSISVFYPNIKEYAIVKSKRNHSLIR